MIPAPLANAIVVIVTLVWAGNFLAAVYLPGYESDSTLSFVFMTIVGGALALRQGSNVVTRLTGRHRPPAPPAPGPPEERP